MPPCAQKVEPEPNWLLESTATRNVVGSCKARLIPAAPLPTTNTSYCVKLGMFRFRSIREAWGSINGTVV